MDCSIYQDNSLIHKGWQQMDQTTVALKSYPHCSYSPDLALSDFFFPKLFPTCFVAILKTMTCCGGERPPHRLLWWDYHASLDKVYWYQGRINWKIVKNCLFPPKPSGWGLAFFWTTLLYIIIKYDWLLIF